MICRAWLSLGLLSLRHHSAWSQSERPDQIRYAWFHDGARSTHLHNIANTEFSALEPRASYRRASACFETGGGYEEPSEQCNGACDTVSALECISDMKNNVSGNVPPGCSLTTLSFYAAPECCPQFAKAGKASSIDRATSAFPDALRCLKSAGCHSSSTYDDVHRECLANECDDSWSCERE